jgi:hypothetical protein
VTWVAYHPDLSEVAVFGSSSFRSILETELEARRYAMEHHMDVIDLPDGEGLRETINAPSRAARESASDLAHRLLGPDIPPADSREPSLLESDLTGLVVETLSLGGCVKLWASFGAKVGEEVTVERYAPGMKTTKGKGGDLSGALIDLRVKEAE